MDRSNLKQPFKVIREIRDRVKIFQCKHCEKKSMTSTQLDVHERLHTDEKPFSCSKCDKTFTQSAHKTTHESLVHFRVERFILLTIMEKSHILAQNAVNHSRRDIAWRCMKECTLEKDAPRVTDVFFTKLQFENS